MVAAPLVGSCAAGDLADLGGPAELAHCDDERLGEQTPVVEVGQERREAAVEHRQDRLLEEREMLAVRVPGSGRSGAAGADGHQPHAGLDQASRQEQALAQMGQAAELARLLGAGIGRVETIPLADRRRSRARGRTPAAPRGSRISAKSACGNVRRADRQAAVGSERSGSGCRAAPGGGPLDPAATRGAAPVPAPCSRASSGRRP